MTKKTLIKRSGSKRSAKNFLMFRLAAVAVLVGVFAIFGFSVKDTLAQLWSEPTGIPPTNNATGPVWAQNSMVQNGDFWLSGKGRFDASGIGDATCQGAKVCLADSTGGYGLVSEMTSGTGGAGPAVYAQGNAGFGIYASSTTNYAGDFVGNVYVTGTLNAATDLQVNGTQVCLSNGTHCQTGGYWTATGNDIYNNNTGKVGIGTVAPSGKLSVGGAGGSAATDGIEWYSGPGNASGYQGYAGRVYVGVPGTGWGTAPFIFSVPNTSGVEVQTMTLLNGNVGIGTTTPGVLLSLGKVGNAGVMSLAGGTGGIVTVDVLPTAGNWTLTLPPNGGTPNQFLQTDGAGNTTWQTVVAGSQTPWTADEVAAGHTLFGNSTTSGNLTLDSNNTGTKGFTIINPTGGDVGIGTATPSSNYGVYNTPLVVQSSASNYTYMELRGVSSQAGILYNRDGSTGWFQGLNGSGFFRSSQMASINQTGLTNAKDGTTGMTIDTSGKVGIVTSTPAATLDVKGAVNFSGATSGYMAVAVPATVTSYTLTFPAAVGASGQVLQTTNATGTLGWVTPSAGGVQTPWAADEAAASHNLTGLGTNLTAAAGLTIASTGAALALNSGSGALTSNATTVTLGGSATMYGGAAASGTLTLNSTSNATKGTVLINSAGGNVGVNQATPGSALDVKGTLRLSGATSGFVGLSPAAAAGGTTYTLPSADGTNGYQLTTNGSGTLSWQAAGGGGGTVTNSGSATNYIAKFTSATNITDSLIYDTGSAVLIGTTTPTTGLLDVETAGVPAAIYGKSSNAAGWGVEGEATGTTGVNLGVYGISRSASGYGVYGVNTTGGSAGVYGNGAIGVFGAGSAYGVQGSATLAGSSAVYGSNISTTGVGVQGVETATSGINYGVYGTTASNSGYGVYGTNTANVGAPVGVYGESSNASQGIGVEGVSTYAGGTAIGVMGKVYSGTGNVSWGIYGVAGSANPASGSGVGVVGSSQDNSGAGVKGMATTSSGANYGVYGTSASVSGYGVYGTNSGGGYAIYSNGNMYATGTIVSPATVQGASISSTGNAFVSATLYSTWISNSGTIVSTGGINTSGGITATNGFNLVGAGVQDSTAARVFDSGGSLFLQQGSGANIYIRNTSGANIGYFNNSGNYYLWSDSRLKKGIISLSYDEGLGAISNLNPISFYWKDPARGEIEQLGFIAQDVQKVFPELVTKGVDGNLTMNYNGLIAPIVKSIQGQQSEIGDQGQQINKLKQQVDDLKLQISELKAK